MKLNVYISTSLAIIVAIFIGFVWWGKTKHIIKTDNAYVRGSITTISSRISGHINMVPGVVNTKIKKGAVLVICDQKPFIAELKQSEADLLETKAQIMEVEAKINSITIEVAEAKARKRLAKAKKDSIVASSKVKISNMDLLKLDLDRTTHLFNKNAVSKSRLDSSEALFSSSEYEVKKFSSEILAADYSIKAIDAEIDEILSGLKKLQAEKLRFEARSQSALANLEVANINLDSTIIKAPIDGIIANRIVEPGVYMEEGWPLMSIVPVKDIWVVSNYKETQMEKIRIGQPVSIVSDIFKGDIIKGKVLSISPASASSFSLLPPQNASGNFVKVVQRIPVKISIDLPKKYIGRLVPGMSVISKVDTSNEK